MFADIGFLPDRTLIKRACEIEVVRDGVTRMQVLTVGSSLVAVRDQAASVCAPVPPRAKISERLNAATESERMAEDGWRMKLNECVRRRETCRRRW